MGENYITCREENGSINIAEEVIVGVVRGAIQETEGVAGLSNTVGTEIAEMIGFKSVPKGVKVQIKDGKIVVDTIITVKYGHNVVNVAKAVQERVLDQVQTATGMADTEINVHVSGIAFEK